MSSNGVISFNKPIEQLVGMFGNEEEYTFREPVIAPLWIDLAHGGSIYYRATNETDILSQASSLIANGNPAFVGFQPTLAVIVTWDRFPIYSNMSITVSNEFIMSCTGLTQLGLEVYTEQKIG